MTASGSTAAGAQQPGVAEAGDAVPDLAERFDEHYLTFYTVTQTAAAAERAATLIVKLLGLAPGTAVLDIPCAFGRIANRLAAQGCRVTGLDAKRLFLARAQQDAEALGVAVEYVAGDMRALPREWAGRFDAAVCWFSSFGYFDDDADRMVLREWRRVLRPGGRLLIEHNALGTFYRRTPPGAKGYYAGLSQVGDALVAYRQDYDPVTGLVNNERVIAQGGRVERHRYAVRQFSFPELRSWLLDAGFARVDAFGGDGGPFTLDSDRMIAVAHAEG